MVRERILVVEDDALVADVVRLQPEELGYVVVGTCSEGPKSVALAGTLQPAWF
jgi:CheY-like chemotaxis protein